MLSLDRFHLAVDKISTVRRSGRVTSCRGLNLVASGPAEAIGQCCDIITRHGPQPAVVVGFSSEGIMLQPLGKALGIAPGDEVVALDRGLGITVGPELLGRVVDGLGQPIDGLGPLRGQARRPVDAEPPAPLARRPIDTILTTGLKVIDTCLTLGKGQRIGIFARAGMGKSVLLGEMAKAAQADVNVIALVGERGREVAEFVHQVLGPAGLARSVVVCATSDRPAVERRTAALLAHTVAEHFRDAGLDVLLMCDSLTRFCQAQRDIGLAAGEPPAQRGYPPSAFAALAPLLERAGTGASGSITGLYTVLMDGDEDDDPVADQVRGIIDGHIMLSQDMAERGVFPAIDIARSVSRLMVDLVDDAAWQTALDAKSCWGEYQRVRELVEIGAYQSGADPRLDRAIAVQPGLEDFIRQGIDQSVVRDQSLQQLAAVLGQQPDAAVRGGA